MNSDSLYRCHIALQHWEKNDYLLLESAIDMLRNRLPSPRIYWYTLWRINIFLICVWMRFVWWRCIACVWSSVWSFCSTEAYKSLPLSSATQPWLCLSLCVLQAAWNYFGCCASVLTLIVKHVITFYCFLLQKINMALQWPSYSGPVLGFYFY